MTRPKRIPNRSIELPQELLIEVLSRLPVKTLIQFMCISKDWLTLISNPNFASIHLINHNNCANKPFILIEGKYWSRQNCLIRRNYTFRRVFEFVRPNSMSFCDVRYVNGVILFNNFSASMSSLTLWNPSIRRFIDVPPPPSLPDHRNVRVGLGFDGVGNDLKVAILTCRETPLRDCPPPPVRSEPFRAFVEVFSVRTRLWKGFSVDTLCVRSLRLDDTAIFLNGGVHWIGCDMSLVPYPLYGSHVMVFNVETEVFSYFPVPSFDDRAYNKTRVLGVLRGSLVFLDLFPERSVIWVMERYGVAESWNKRYSFDLVFDKFLYFRSNGELFVVVNNHEIKKYDIESLKISDLAKSYRNQVVFMDVFVESLMLLTQGDNLIDIQKNSNDAKMKITEIIDLED